MDLLVNSGKVRHQVVSFFLQKTLCHFPSDEHIYLLVEQESEI